MPAGQKRALTTDGCEIPCVCWELNSGPLVEQPALLTGFIGTFTATGSFLLKTNVIVPMRHCIADPFKPREKQQNAVKTFTASLIHNCGKANSHKINTSFKKLVNEPICRL